jgi:hypothetical protein
MDTGAHRHMQVKPRRARAAAARARRRRRRGRRAASGGRRDDEAGARRLRPRMADRPFLRRFAPLPRPPPSRVPSSPALPAVAVAVAPSSRVFNSAAPAFVFKSACAWPAARRAAAACVAWRVRRVVPARGRELRDASRRVTRRAHLREGGDDVRAHLDTGDVTRSRHPSRRVTPAARRGSSDAHARGTTRRRARVRSRPRVTSPSPRGA